MSDQFIEFLEQKYRETEPPKTPTKSIPELLLEAHKMLKKKLIEHADK